MRRKNLGQGKWLTPAEARIVRLLARGLTYREIALRLEIKTQTVSNAVSVVLHRFGARNRVQLALLWGSRRRR